MKLAICEDEPVFLEQIKSLAESCLSGYADCLSIDLFLSGEELCRELERGITYDIACLDICMGEMSGIDVGLKLRKYFSNTQTVLIYISSYDNRAKEAFYVNAHRFLAKPIERTLFEEAIVSAYQLATKSEEKRFSFKDPVRGEVDIPLNGILYFEVNRAHRVDVATQECAYAFYGKLNDVQARLSSDDFLRIHQSILINYDCIDLINYKEVKMTNGAILPISGPRRKSVRELYMEIRRRRQRETCR